MIMQHSLIFRFVFCMSSLLWLGLMQGYSACGQEFSPNITHRLEDCSFANFSNGEWGPGGTLIYIGQSQYHTFGDPTLDPDNVDFKLFSLVCVATKTLSNQWDIQLPAYVGQTAEKLFVGSHVTGGLEAYGNFEAQEVDGYWFHVKSVVRDRSLGGGAWTTYEEHYTLYPKTHERLPK